MIRLLHYFFPITPTWTRSIPARQFIIIIVVSFFVLIKKVVENQTWRSVISHTQKHGLKNKYIHGCKKLPDITSLASCMLLDIVETLFFSVKDSFSKWFIILEESWGKSSQNLVSSCIKTTHPSVFHGIDFVLFLSEVKYMSLRSCKHYLDEINIWTVNNNIYHFFQLVHWTFPVVNWEQACWTFVWS